jgi:hypothetical protein
MKEQKLPTITVPPLNPEQFGMALGLAVKGLPYADTTQLAARAFGLTLTSGRRAAFEVSTEPNPQNPAAATIHFVVTMIDDGDTAEATAIVHHLVRCLPFFCEVVAGRARAAA